MFSNYDGKTEIDLTKVDVLTFTVYNLLYVREV